MVVREGQGIKYDDGKLRYDLLPPLVLEEIVAVLSYGARKYSDSNWKRVKPFKKRYYAAALRHIQDWWKGEKWDKESSYNHLAHACCCLIFLMTKELKNEQKNRVRGPSLPTKTGEQRGCGADNT